jgi:hypothetical protein
LVDQCTRCRARYRSEQSAKAQRAIDDRLNRTEEAQRVEREARKRCAAAVVELQRLGLRRSMIRQGALYEKKRLLFPSLGLAGWPVGMQQWSWPGKFGGGAGWFPTAIVATGDPEVRPSDGYENLGNPPQYVQLDAHGSWHHERSCCVPTSKIAAILERAVERRRLPDPWERLEG